MAKSNEISQSKGCYEVIWGVTIAKNPSHAFRKMGYKHAGICKPFGAKLGLDY